MLDKHLTVKTYPKANDENIVFYKDLRITVLSDRLFRIEKNASGEFCDDATQSIWYRNMPPVSFSVKEGRGYTEIKTDAVTLHASTDREKSYVLIGGKRVTLDNEENLLGTTRTLDCYDGDVCVRANRIAKLKLGTGVCSRSGVAVIDDAASLRLLDTGSLAPAFGNEYDLYVFAYGNDYRGAVRALYTVTGEVPLLPRFAFGNWWSRYHQYSDDEYISLMDKFERYGIPLTVATVDMDWHYSKRVDEQKGLSANGKISAELGTLFDRPGQIGWTGYSWNTDLFPDYKRFLKDLKERNLKVTLNLHPADGVRFFEDMYTEMAEAMGVDPETEKPVKFDIADDNFVNNYFKILHHPYEKDGVDFWWMDWQQGTRSSMDGLDPLWALNHYHYLDNKRDGKHGLVLSRYAGIGSHRYTMGFSGDTSISWATLGYLPYFTATSANVGFTWWGHDIGGHHMGGKDNELYIRFLQFGVFNPFMRLHCTNNIVLTHEPWTYDNGIGELAREMMKLRHSMIPFLHTANYRTHKDGIALMEPMYYQYPDSEDSYNAKDQYLFGGSLIVAPISSHSIDKGLSRVKVWLPEGRWTDIFTGDVYSVKEGGMWLECIRPLNSIPVFAGEGAIIPLSRDMGNSVANPTHLEAEVYNGNSQYTLYEDDDHGNAAFTDFVNSYENGKTTVKISSRGDFSSLPDDRRITLTFKNIVINTPVDTRIGAPSRRRPLITVLKNGEPIEFKADTYETVSVSISDIDYRAEYVITVEYDELSELALAKRSAYLKLQRVEAPLSVRNLLSDAMRNANSTEQLGCIIRISDLDPIDRERLCENIY